MPEDNVSIKADMPPWDVVVELAKTIDPRSWELVGGLMVQAHALLANRISRATKDVDMLVNLMVSGLSASSVVKKLEAIGFEAQEPGLRRSVFHRLRRDSSVVDILIADHLPSGKRESAKFNRWPMMEMPGGAQAIERAMPVQIECGRDSATVLIPDLLGAIVLKAAAYSSDRRSRERHLEDIALLSSLVVDVRMLKEQMRGSDAKRIRAAWKALSNVNDPAWLLLVPDERQKGHDTLRVLAS